MKYTIDNPKLIKNTITYRPKSFTGVVKDENGTIAYYQNGIFHRTDGPAIICANGWKEWRVNGLVHREDGPAVELPNGEKRWFYKGFPCGINDNFTIESWIKRCFLEVFK